jgi:hypothetical protein
MKYKDLCQALITETLVSFEELNVVSKSSNDHVRFELKTPYGKNVFYYNLIRSGDTYRASLYLTVFHSSVEIAHGLALGLKKKSIDIRNTIAWTIDVYSGQSMQYYPLETSADIHSWCAICVEYLRQEGMQLLNSYNDILDLDRLFNSSPTQELPLCSYLLSRAEKGIIIAKLCQSKTLSNLIQQYRDILVSQDILLTYDEVVNFIERYSVEELYQLKI